MIEITELGWLSIGAMLIGIMAGGQLVGGGFIISAEIPRASEPTLLLTPITIWRVNNTFGNLAAGGFTLGGTIVYVTARNELASEIELYELGHVWAWAAYGLQYPNRIASDTCLHDPRAGWASHCPNKIRPPQLLIPRSGAIRWGGE